MDINKFMTTDNTITPNYFIEQIRLKDKEKRELINIASIHWKQWIINALNDGIAAYPEVVKVEWCQYTPNFNDGDTCRFSVHDPIFIMRQVKKFTKMKLMTHLKISLIYMMRKILY